MGGWITEDMKNKKKPTIVVCGLLTGVCGLYDSAGDAAGIGMGLFAVMMPVMKIFGVNEGHARQTKENQGDFQYEKLRHLSLQFRWNEINHHSKNNKQQGQTGASFRMVTAIAFEIEQKKHRGKYHAENAHRQTQPAIRTQSHFLIPPLFEHADYNSHDEQAQCHKDTRDKIGSNQRFLSHYGQDQANKAQFACVIEEFRQIFQKEFIHSGGLYQPALTVSR